MRMNRYDMCPAGDNKHLWIFQSLAPPPTQISLLQQIPVYDPLLSPIPDPE
ncbi:hypothetical protein AVEN_123700-1, partial [Araneus ventricosus]